MAIKYHDMPEKLSEGLEIANYVFAFIFNLEMIFKMIGFSKFYFYSYWNLFDFLVVIGTDVGILFRVLQTGSDVATAATIVRAFRIMRIFRLIRSSKNLKVLIDTLVYILPSLGNIGSLIFLSFFIFAVLGINIFSGVMLQDELNALVNFRSFGTTLLVLMRCATGENWNYLMSELANKSGYRGQACLP